MPDRSFPRRIVCRAAMGFVAMLAAQVAASAQPADAFFRNRQISFVVGYNPGGSYDLYSSLAVNALSRFIPGNPSIVLKHMPGFGGLKAANYLHTQAPRDGTTIGMVSQAAALRQALGEAGIEFDARRLSWIGRLASAVEVTLAWRTSGVFTLDDARRRELVIAATAAGSTTEILPRLMNLIAGTKFKIIKGYQGTTGGSLAMERGETEGTHETIDTLLFTKADCIRDNKVSVLVQYALQRHPAFPAVPAMVEVARTPEQRQILALFGGTAEIGRSIVGPPELPPERLETLRRAFDAMTVDAGFRAEVARRNLDLGPLDGEAVQRLIEETLATPRPVIDQAAAIANQ